MTALLRLSKSFSLAPTTFHDEEPMGLSVIDLICKDFVVGDIGEKWSEQARRRCSLSKS